MAKTIGLEIDLPELANLTPSDLIALSGGGYVVSFAGYRGPNDTSGRTAFAVLDDQGGVVAGPSPVTNRSQGGDGYESMLALSNGGFAITWVGNQGLAGQSPQLYMRFFDATGTAASKRITIDSELKSSLVAEPVLLETPGGVRVAFVESDDFFFNLNTADIAPGGRVSNREVIDIGAVPGTPQGEILDNGKAVYALNAGIGGIARVETRANGDFIGDDRIDMILDSYSFRNTAGDPVIAELASRLHHRLEWRWTRGRFLCRRWRYLGPAL